MPNNALQLTLTLPLRGPMNSVAELGAAERNRYAAELRRFFRTNCRVHAA